MTLNIVRKITFNFKSLLCIIALVELGEAWDLSIFGVNQTTTPVKHVTIIKNKAYLSIPRKTKEQLMTFIEAPWPENTKVPNTPRLFPSRRLQVLGDCDSLQSILCSDTDLEGQLYVLDVGFGKCPPKIVTYDGVFQKKVTGIIFDLKKVDGSKLTSMMVDNFEVGGPRVYIAYTEGLIIFNIHKRHWWFIKLAPPEEIIDFYPQKFTLEPQQMALSKNKPILYFTTNNTDYLFGIDARMLRSLPVPYQEFCEDIEHEFSKVSVQFQGQLIGQTKGLTCDDHNGLYYYIPRFYVLVRWNTRSSLVAENHDVILQSAKLLPQIEQIFIDAQSTWVLLGLPNQYGMHCEQIQKRIEKNIVSADLTTRKVKKL